MRGLAGEVRVGGGGGREERGYYKIDIQQKVHTHWKLVRMVSPMSSCGRVEGISGFVPK